MSCKDCIWYREKEGVCKGPYALPIPIKEDWEVCHKFEAKDYPKEVKI